LNPSLFSGATPGADNADVLGGETEDGLKAEAGLLFDETITDHWDIESIMFLSERLQQVLRGMENGDSAK
jgi:hypothetical protein